MSNYDTFDPFTHSMVNDIPTGYFFKKKCGRTGHFCFKKSDYRVDAIVDALKELEGYRNINSLVAIGKLRAVRRKCYRLESEASMAPMGPASKPQDVKISKQLHDVIDKRIKMIATFIRGEGKAQNIQEIDERMFNAFYDDVAVRPVWGPGRKLDNHYRGERATTRHIPHSTTAKWHASDTKLALNDWLDTVYKWEREDNDNNQNLVVKTNGVEYLDAQARQQYELHVQGGRVSDVNGQPAHTGPMRSITLGPGWGIYVMSFAGQIYLGEHTVDEFHHSSFMSGVPVRAGGEIAINNGIIVGLTNKTGHYKARPQELNHVMTKLTHNFVDVSRIAVQDNFNKPNHWYTGTDAMSVNCQLAQLGASTSAKPTVV